MVNKSLLLLLFFGLVVGQVGRITIGDNVSFTILDIGIFLCGSSVLLKYKLQTKNLPLFVPFTCLVTLFIFTWIIHVFSQTLAQNIASLLYTIRFFYYFLIFYFIKEMFVKEKKFVINLLTISGMLIVLLGFVQYAFYQNLRNLYYLGWDDHLYRLFSTFLDPNFAGAFFVLFLLFLFPFLQINLNKRNVKQAVMYLFLIACTILALGLTFSRSALIMLVVSVSLYLLLIGQKRLIAALGILLIIYMILISSKSYLENMNLFRIASSEARLQSAQEALTIIKDHPVLGIGFNNYRYEQVKYGFRNNNPKYQSHSDAGTDNSFLFVLATTGVVGLLIYLFFWKSIIEYAKLFVKKKRLLSLSFISSVVGLFINSLFINNLFYPETLLWVWILLGIMDYM